jgi:hypothetical protein
MTSNLVRGGALAAVSILAIGFGTALLRADTRPAPGMQDLASKGEWLVTTQYAVDDLVFSRGSTWRAKVANKGKQPGATNPNNAAFWDFFAEGFNPTGAWINNKVYHINDLVTLNGQTWRAKITNVNASPAANANWELLAAKGAAGSNGTTGPAGPNTGIGAGTASAPSISFTGDAGTGIFHPAVNKIALVEGGSLFLHNLGTSNTSLGLGALGSLTSGGQNSAFGHFALAANTSGANNTAFGYLALQVNTTGQSNTALGESSLPTNTTGSYNIGVGNSALFANTTGSNNVVMGVVAMLNNTTGATNVAIGNSALNANTTGSENLAVGNSALHDNTTGGKNIAVGLEALKSNDTGANNTAVGYQALNLQTAGDDNVAVGNRSLASNTATGNTAVGFQALSNNTTGSQNVAVGPNALQTNINGGGNVGIGINALVNNQAGNNNIAIGPNAALNPSGSSDSIFIGNTGDPGDNAVIKIGTVGVPDTQTTTFIAGIKDAGGGGSSVQVYIDSTTGQLTGPPVSSARYKEDIRPVEDLTGVLNKLRPVTFRYKTPASDGSKPLQYGLIAEEVAGVMPYLAVFNPDGTLRTVHYDRLPTFLLAGYQAQQKTIDKQADEIAMLKERLAAIEAALPRVTKAALQ